MTTRIDLFTVPREAVPRALVRMGTDRRRLTAAAPLFWKLLGTGDGRTFDARDADLRRWGVLTVWPTTEAASGFPAACDVVGGWSALADEHWWVTLRTLRAAGQWSGRQPFGEPPPATERAAAERRPVASLTRARLRWSRATRFWRAVPAVNTDLDAADGLRLRLGIGEAPLGLQGTFSVWRSVDAMRAFAHRGAPHRDVMRRSSDERWYGEELFARFAITSSGGTVFGGDPLA